MKQMQYICDRCGKPLISEALKIVPHYFDLDTEDLIKPVSGAVENMHFCVDCTMHILDEMQPKKQSAKDPPQKDPSPAEVSSIIKPRKLDTGKIMALYTAGWKKEDIAREIGATEKQVYQCIYYNLHPEKYKASGKEELNHEDKL